MYKKKNQTAYYLELSYSLLRKRTGLQSPTSNADKWSKWDQKAEQDDN